ncbi:MAG: ATP-dependent DNA helicase RecG [Candidatus Omnitrophota bacterium]|jgi:ATP-dependent DNA helicase RecG|nr:MAG: ATP-dependent DNA helicase RecG [Candidatus Omnitrophota bacterium]
MSGKSSASPKKKEKPKVFQGEGLDTPIMFCPGVGPQRAKLFEKMGILTVRDLLWHIPRGFEDFHTRTPIRNLIPGQVTTVLGKVTFYQPRIPRNLSKVRHIFNVTIEDHSGSMQVVWFNQPFLEGKIRNGLHLLLHGKAELYDHYIQMSNPKLKIVEEEHAGAAEFMPVYPLTQGLTHTIIKKVVQHAFERFQSYLQEFLPPFILADNRFPTRTETFRILHTPQPGEGAPTDIELSEADLLQQKLFETQNRQSPSVWRTARNRLIFEEFFLHQLILRRYRAKVKKLDGISHIPPSPDPLSDIISSPLDPSTPSHWPAIFLQNLPFQFTEDQYKVCREIQEELCSPAPMNRLLHGDVGSGKTVVSLYAMLVAAAGGYQAALMAPTEILAQQHAASIRRLTACIPSINVVVLTGSVTAKESREILQAVACGSAHIVIGTHALFQERVNFARLGLVVVDEQHKFGVAQRQHLMEKGDHPDLLVTTATPIPRTLSLTLFGDMDNSVIRTLPPGRPPIVTRWTTWENERKIWEFVDQKIEAGQQAYVVCPIIEPSENAPQLPSTEEAFERLSQTFLPHRRVEILHGRHSANMKSDVMEKMRAGEIDVVVATTVIEVGVDLPNAAIIVILGADRFGLAQLHQLRGRVGRGTQKSFCILVTPAMISPFAEQRMKVLEQTRDGFKIAEEDLKLRGPGEYFGTRQSGHLKFRIGDPFEDAGLLREAYEAADRLHKTDPNLIQTEHEALKEELRRVLASHEFNRPS